jgi:hypothetical protein
MAHTVFRSKLVANISHLAVPSLLVSVCSSSVLKTSDLFPCFFQGVCLLFEMWHRDDAFFHEKASASDTSQLMTERMQLCFTQGVNVAWPQPYK